jgi:hypothetical protein
VKLIRGRQGRCSEAWWRLAGPAQRHIAQRHEAKSLRRRMRKEDKQVTSTREAAQPGAEAETSEAAQREGKAKADEAA